MSSRIRFIASLLLALIACNDNPTEPTTGRLEVLIHTLGGDIDQNGYTLFVGGKSKPVGIDEIVVLENVDAGMLDLSLAGLADNCALEGTHSRAITVLPTQTVRVEFVVTCDATGIEITTQSIGADQPPSGYLVETGDRVAQVPTQGTVLLGRLLPGTHIVSLKLERNCTAAPANVVKINVTYRAVTAAMFEITCVRVDRSIAFQRDTVIRGAPVSSILTAGADGTAPIVVAVGYTPAWSPDGKRLVYSSVVCDWDYVLSCAGGLVILDVETGTQTTLEYGNLGVQPAWSPDGKHIAFIRTAADGLIRPILKVLALDGTTAISIPTPGVSPYEPSWSPDGERIAFECDISEHQSEICTVNRNGTGFVQITSIGSNNVSPAWSPEGSKIAFTTLKNPGKPTVALTSSDGAGFVELTNGFEPAWSPDGSKLIFARTEGLFTMLADGAQITRITNGPFHHAPAWR